VNFDGGCVGHIPLGIVFFGVNIFDVMGHASFPLLFKYFELFQQ